MVSKIAQQHVTTTILQSVLLESADYQKLQQNIKQKFGVDVSIDSLRHMYSFYQLLEKVNPYSR